MAAARNRKGNLDPEAAAHVTRRVLSATLHITQLPLPMQASPTFENLAPVAWAIFDVLQSFGASGLVSTARKIEDCISKPDCTVTIKFKAEGRRRRRRARTPVESSVAPGP